MTTVISWFGADLKKGGHRPASLYFASDSRISWAVGNRPYPKWDYGKKVFASSQTPDIFAFAGKVEAAIPLLSQVVSLADHNVLFDCGDSPEDRFGKFCFAVKRSWDAYPWKGEFTLQFLHGFRIGEGKNAQFFVGVLEVFRGTTEWQQKLFPCKEGQPSSVLQGLGTGESSALEHISKWQEVGGNDTSRSVFSGFCMSIESQHDEASGGAPQLARLYRIGNGASCGITWKDQRYFDGQLVYKKQFNKELEWRNRLFERVDGNTQERLPGAQAHKDVLVG